MIKKKGTKYIVYDESGTKKLGEHSSRKKAVAQIQAIEISKKKRKK